MRKSSRAESSRADAIQTQTSPLRSSSNADQPDNVYAEKSSNLRSYDTERARIQWAWMANSRGNAQKKAVQGVDESIVRNDLLDVVRLLSSSTIETQTVEPSFIMSKQNVKMETDHHRSIGSQAGVPKQRANKAMQVVEADIVVSGRNGNLYSQRLSTLEEEVKRLDDDEDKASKVSDYGVLTAGSSERREVTASHYRPTCSLRAEEYPAFMSDAQALGVSNRYGFVSLPQHVVYLPPRRKRKFVEPVEVPHMYGTHDLALDDGVTLHLSRAHSLWSQSSGFVPKY